MLNHNSHSIVPALGVAHRIDFSKSKSFLDVAGGSVCVCVGVFKYLQAKQEGDTIPNIAAHLSLSVRSVEALVGTVAALGYLK